MQISPSVVDLTAEDVAVEPCLPASLGTTDITPQQVTSSQPWAINARGSVLYQPNYVSPASNNSVVGSSDVNLAVQMNNQYHLANVHHLLPQYNGGMTNTYYPPVAILPSNNFFQTPNISTYGNDDVL